MTRPTRFCRVAWIVDDMDATVAQFRDLFGLSMRFGPIAPDIIKAGIDEHGFEPIQLFVPAAELPFMQGLPYPLVEVAVGQQIDQQFGFAAIVGVECPARIAGRLGDALDRRRRHPAARKFCLGRATQPFARLLLRSLAAQSRHSLLPYTLDSGYIDVFEESMSAM